MEEQQADSLVDDEVLGEAVGGDCLGQPVAQRAERLLDGGDRRVDEGLSLGTQRVEEGSHAGGVRRCAGEDLLPVQQRLAGVVQCLQ